MNQAAGMVAVQAGCVVEDALVLMGAAAVEAHVTLDEIADAVIDGSIHFR